MRAGAARPTLALFSGYSIYQQLFNIGMSRTALATVERLRGELAEIGKRVTVDWDTTTAYQRLERWTERAVRQISQEVSASEGQRVTDAELRSFQMGNPLGNLQRQLQAYDSVLATLVEEIERDPDFIVSQQRQPEPTSESASGNPAASDIDTQQVFIVHGHDEVSTMQLERLLRDRFRLKPVIMSAQPGRGRTLIEKFEDSASSCGFAFVLLTPDDQVATGSGKYTQARPNVIFELGWFYGRLGRNRVAMLLKEGTQIHSDLDGVSRIQFTRSIEEKNLEIERELMDAGVLAFHK